MPSPRKSNVRPLDFLRMEEDEVEEAPKESVTPKSTGKSPNTVKK
jgi:hypothetical protein